MSFGRIQLLGYLPRHRGQNFQLCLEVDLVILFELVYILMTDRLVGRYDKVIRARGG